MIIHPAAKRIRVTSGTQGPEECLPKNLICCLVGLSYFPMANLSADLSFAMMERNIIDGGSNISTFVQYCVILRLTDQTFEIKV